MEILPNIHRKETVTDTYSGDYFKDYAKDRAKRLSEGWKILDINLLQKDVTYYGVTTISYVTGCVVYERSIKPE